MDEIIHVKNEYRQQRWAELIRQRQESGMTVVGFCEANGIKAKTYNFLSGKYRSWGKKGYYCFGGFPIIEIRWANWDKSLISADKGTAKRDNPYDYGEKKHKPGVSMKMISYLVNTSKYIKNSRLAMFRISKYSSVKGINQDHHFKWWFDSGPL